MSYANRKRKSGPREPNGRPQRPTTERLAEMERERYLADMKQVMNQPHRRGAPDQTDPRLESAFGRFCIRHKLRREISSAADNFSALVRGWRAAKGVPTEIRCEGSGNGLGPSDEAVKAWGERIAKIEHAVLAKVDNRGYLAFRLMVLEDRESDPRYDDLAREAAFWMAVEIGTISLKENPFV